MTQQMEMIQKRDCSLDIAKAICIILMVIGHSGCPDYLYRFIYMFHMPCFFFISGWLLSDKYLSDLKTGFIRKAKGSYWQYVKWMLVFLLAHNLLAQLYFYDSSYSLQEIAIRVVLAFALAGGDPLLGGFWFLVSLFWASAVSLLFLWFLRRIGKLTNIYISGGVVFMILIAMCEKWLPFNLPYQFGEQTMLAIAFYLTGYLFRKINTLNIKHPTWAITAFAIPFATAICMEASMTTTKGFEIPLYYFVALSGIMGVLSLSRWIVQYSPIASFFKYVGDKTLYILVFHFPAFRLVSYAYITSNNLPPSLLKFHTINDAPSWLWVAYAIVGLAISLLMWEINNRISLKTRH